MSRQTNTMSTNKQPKRGRPELPEERRANVEIGLRVTSEQKGAWVASARVSGETLAAWMKRVCNDAADYDPASGYKPAKSDR